MKRSGPSILIHEFVTGGGLSGAPIPPCWEAEGLAMRRALAEDFAAIPGARVSMTLDARFPIEAGRWEVVRVGPGEELPIFGRRAAMADSTLAVAPETDGLLFDRARVLDRGGHRSLGSSPEAIAAAGNKLVAYDRLQGAGVATPPTLAIGRDDPWPARFPGSEVERPMILKPVDGAGSLRTYRIEAGGGWPDPLWRPSVAVLQPWIEGESRSASLIVSATGRPHVLGFGRQRSAIIEDGRVAYRGGTLPIPFVEDELRMVSRVVRAFPGLRGWVGIDYVAIPGGPPVVVDVNPRPTTSIVAYRSILEPGMLAEALLGIAIDGDRQLPAGLLDRIRDALARTVRFETSGTVESSARDGGGH